VHDIWPVDSLPCGSALCAGTKQQERDAAVNRFAKDPSVGVLLMNELGSVSVLQACLL